MSKYLIVAAKVEGGEVVEADVRMLGRDRRTGDIVLDDGHVLGRADLANLAHSDEIFAASSWEGGTYEVGRRCRCKPGQDEFLTCVDDNGAPTDDLLKLPPLR